MSDNLQRACSSPCHTASCHSRFKRAFRWSIAQTRVTESQQQTQGAVFYTGEHAKKNDIALSISGSGALTATFHSFSSVSFRSRHPTSQHRLHSPLLSVGMDALLTLRLLPPTPQKGEVICAPNPAPARCAMAAPILRRLDVARIIVLDGVADDNASCSQTASTKKSEPRGTRVTSLRDSQSKGTWSSIISVPP